MNFARSVTHFIFIRVKCMKFFYFFEFSWNFWKHLLCRARYTYMKKLYNAALSTEASRIPHIRGFDLSLFYFSNARVWLYKAQICTYAYLLAPPWKSSLKSRSFCVNFAYYSYIYGEWQLLREILFHIRAHVYANFWRSSPIFVLLLFCCSNPIFTRSIDSKFFWVHKNRYFSHSPYI